MKAARCDPQEPGHLVLGRQFKHGVALVSWPAETWSMYRGSGVVNVMRD